ncbi:hypothetical protein [Clostridium thermosuccinogenes]|jgi:hypothetical protein|uniref:hypothetical protein n=1 Tax=Clostridium thermosuccinogenes TaxID=84032 RepID=UPI001379E361|nr:hypothetical protein [Pseudoclostridium thermosuccinogenes]
MVRVDEIEFYKMLTIPAISDPIMYSTQAPQIKTGKKIKKKYSFLRILLFIALNLYTAILANSMGIAPKVSHINARSFHVIGSIASGFVT